MMLMMPLRWACLGLVEGRAADDAALGVLKFVEGREELMMLMMRS